MKASIRIAGAAIVLALSGAAWPQSYSTKPVRIMVGYTPGVSAAKLEED